MVALSGSGARRSSGHAVPDPPSGGPAGSGTAAAAEKLDVAVLHYDADFDLIASVTGQRSQWVVPAGTVE